jgi:2-keto-myo-inositol isomerase
LATSVILARPSPLTAICAAGHIWGWPIGGCGSHFEFAECISDMNPHLGRRSMLAQTGLALGAAAAGSLAATGECSAAEPKPATSAGRTNPAEPFGYCFNTSTIRGQNLGLVEEIEIISRAGYQGIEPWVREIDEYVKGGGSLPDLGKRLRDLNLSVESVIGFFEWIVDDDTKRAKALDEAKRNFELVAAIGGKRLAAPPVGATDIANFDLNKAADRYGELLALGNKAGVTPMVEVWGFSKTLGTLGAALMVAADCGHAGASILPDVYHLYKGGSDIAGLKLLTGSAIGVFHFNDYPANPPRAEITDAHRVYPGDGVAQIADLLKILRDIGYTGMLSLEVFNREYWKQDALLVASTGLDKMRTIVRKSLA